MKVGRNEPCPCGSGKKYKNCCLGNDAQQQTGFDMPLDAFLDPESLEALNNPKHLQEYNRYIQDSQGISHAGKTFMEFLGKPNLATEQSKLLEQALEGKVFQNESDVNRFVNEWTQVQKHKPIDDFLGLSSEQVSRIRHAKRLDEIDDIIRISSKALPPVAAKAKIPAIAMWILEHLYNNPKGLSLTATGNFKTDLVKNLVQAFFANEERSKYIKNENDLYELRITHYLLEQAEYINESKTNCRLSSKGKTLLETQNTDILYRDLFGEFLLNVDWSVAQYYNIIGDDIYFIQSSGIVALRILDVYASQTIDFSSIYSAYIRAFPMFNKPQSPQIRINLHKSSFYHLFIEVFCGNMGLVEVSTIELAEKEVPSIKVTPLFKHLIDWGVPLPKSR